MYPDQSDTDKECGDNTCDAMNNGTYSRRNYAYDAEINLGYLKEINVREKAGVIKYDCYVNYLKNTNRITSVSLIFT